MDDGGNNGGSSFKVEHQSNAEEVTNVHKAKSRCRILGRGNVETEVSDLKLSDNELVICV